MKAAVCLSRQERPDVLPGARLQAIEDKPEHVESVLLLLQVPAFELLIVHCTDMQRPLRGVQALTQGWMEPGVVPEVEHVAPRDLDRPPARAEAGVRV